MTNPYNLVHWVNIGCCGLLRWSGRWETCDGGAFEEGRSVTRKSRSGLCMAGKGRRGRRKGEFDRGFD